MSNLSRRRWSPSRYLDGLVDDDEVYFQPCGSNQIGSVSARSCGDGEWRKL